MTRALQVTAPTRTQVDVRRSKVRFELDFASAGAAEDFVMGMAWFDAHTRVARFPVGCVEINMSGWDQRS